MLTLAFANRHGLVTGATGTGKTVTLQVLAEGPVARRRPGVRRRHQGRPVGHLRGRRGQGRLRQRAKEHGLRLPARRISRRCSGTCSASRAIRCAPPSRRWGRCCCRGMMDLNDVQEGVLNIAFRVADEQGLLLLDLKDLRAMLGYLAEHAAELTTQYGNVSKATVGTIQRQLLVLENQGGTKFFGEPALALTDLMKKSSDGRGYINILVADKLMESPRLYATFLLWLLSELFEQTAGGRRSRQAEARVLLRRGASAVQRCAEGAARPDRAGGAADPLQGRRRLLRHAEPDRRAGQGAGPARQPRAARAARLHAARPEGGAGGGRDVPAQSRSSTPPRSSRSWARARRWCRSSKATARRRWSSASWSARRRRGIGPITPEERKIQANSPVKGKYDIAIDAESAYEQLQKRTTDTAHPGGPMPPAAAPARRSAGRRRHPGRSSAACSAASSAPTRRAARG